MLVSRSLEADASNPVSDRSRLRSSRAINESSPSSSSVASESKTSSLVIPSARATSALASSSSTASRSLVAIRAKRTGSPSSLVGRELGRSMRVATSSRSNGAEVRSGPCGPCTRWSSMRIGTSVGSRRLRAVSSRVHPSSGVMGAKPWRAIRANSGAPRCAVMPRPCCFHIPQARLVPTSPCCRR